MIVYFYVKLAVPSVEIDLRLEPNEVAACAWLDQDQLAKILNRDAAYRDEIVRATDSDFNVKDYKLKMFFPYYPNDNFTGIGKASTYALKFSLVAKAQRDFAKL